MTAADRLAHGYEPRFDIDSEVGRQGEIFIASVVDAIKNGASHEVKTDVQALRTGNFYVEFECLRRGRWEKSGIATTEAELWGFVLGESAFFVPTALLRDLARERHRQGRIKSCDRGSHPTRGVIVSIAWLISHLGERRAA